VANLLLELLNIRVRGLLRSSQLGSLDARLLSRGSLLEISAGGALLVTGGEVRLFLAGSY